MSLISNWMKHWVFVPPEAVTHKILHFKFTFFLQSIFSHLFFRAFLRPSPMRKLDFRWSKGRWGMVLSLVRIHFYPIIAFFWKFYTYFFILHRKKFCYSVWSSFASVLLCVLWDIFVWCMRRRFPPRFCMRMMGGGGIILHHGRCCSSPWCSETWEQVR